MDPLSIPFGGAVMDPLSIPFGGAVMDSRAVPSSEKLCCTLMLISLAALTRKLLAAPGRAGLPSSTFPPSVRPSVRPQQQQRGRGLPDPSRRAPCSVLSEEESIRFKEVCFALSLPSPFSSPFWLRCLVFQASLGGSASPPLGGESWGRGFGVWFLNHSLTLGSGREELGGGGVDFCTRGRTVGASPPVLPLPHSSCSRQGSARTTPSCPKAGSPPRAPLPSTQPPPPCLIVGFCPPNPSCAVLMWGGRPAEGVARVSAPLLPQGRICLQLLLLTLPHLPPPSQAGKEGGVGRGSRGWGHTDPPPPLLWVQDPILAHRRRSAVAARPVPPVRDA